jgi:hypothetical protein
VKETLDDAGGLPAATDAPTLNTPDRAAKTSRSDVMALSFNVNQWTWALGALINLLGYEQRSM